MASLLCTPSNLQEVLTQLDLLQYHDALIEAGYELKEDVNFFEQASNSTVKEMTEELKEDVPMKKPHARALVRYLFSVQHCRRLVLAPAAQDVDGDDLPIAEAIPMSRVLNNPSSFDPACDPAVPQLMEKEMPDQMKRDQKAANTEQKEEEAVASVKTSQLKEHEDLKSLPVLDFRLGTVIKFIGRNMVASDSYEFNAADNKTVQFALNLDEVSKKAIETSRVALYCGLASTDGIKVWDNDDKNIMDCCALKFDLPTEPGQYELKLWEDKNDPMSPGYTSPLCKNESGDQISIKFVVRNNDADDMDDAFVKAYNESGLVDYVD